MNIIWPIIIKITQLLFGLQDAAPKLPLTWIERIFWLIGLALLLANQLFGVVGKRKSEIHITDLAHITSLQGLLATKKAELEEEKAKTQSLTVTKMALEESLAQAKKELTALALIEIGKLLNFAQERADREAAEKECERLRVALANSELQNTRDDVARQSGEWKGTLK